MKTIKFSAAALAVSALVVACGGGGSAGDGASFDLSGARGSLQATPSALATLSPAEFQAAAPATLFAVAGAPKCTVTFNYFTYGTVGGAGETTTATGGIMVPSGADAACQGPRPVLLYGHGTNLNKNMNMASPREVEAAVVAATYAAQGYIVVAPNYAGYDASTLPYHPYLNADQQSKDMIDALTAARKGFAAIGANANAKLFVSGYSQGGHVSLATQRALQAAGTPVTAGAHLSGTYAMADFGDAVFEGNVNLGATVFTPLLTTSYQKAYGNIYSSVNDLYESQFATGIESLLPAVPATATTTDVTAQVIGSGKLPATFLFEGTTAPFFGTPNLVKTSYRAAVRADIAANRANPKHPLRVASKANDLSAFVPNKPVLLCGGNMDPTVFFRVNTEGYKAKLDAAGVPAQLATVLDVDSAAAATDPPEIQLVKGGFAAAKKATNDAAVAAGADAAGAQQAVARAYHGTLVPPFCQRAARGFFSQF